MRIVLLSPASSIHTIRWANGLASKGIEIHLISQTLPNENLHKKIKFYLLPNRGIIGYYLMVPAVKKLLNKIKPDLLNAHYASGYGTTARLVNFHPYILSVWGSDVYDFPYKSFIHKNIVKKNILAADKVASTSRAMAEQIKTIAPSVNTISITPFGIDIDIFGKLESLNSIKNSNITIGTVKSMANVYGIDILIKSFAILYNKLLVSQPEVAEKLHLRLVGEGKETKYLKELTNTLNIEDRVEFVGYINYLDVPKMLNTLDIYVALSRRESFGVAIIEASATFCPVVVSNVGGLPEVVLDGITGIIVPPENPLIAAEALEKLVLSPSIRRQMGVAGRKFIEDNYTWTESLNIMVALYKSIVSTKK